MAREGGKASSETARHLQHVSAVINAKLLPALGAIRLQELKAADLKRYYTDQALQSNNLGQREFARILKMANVRRITLHGLRHTSATLLLKAGVAPHVVQQRLGHKRVEITLGIYAHVLPSMQQDAAQRLGALLYGRS